MRRTSYCCAFAVESLVGWTKVVHLPQHLNFQKQKVHMERVSENDTCSGLNSHLLPV